MVVALHGTKTVSGTVSCENGVSESLVRHPMSNSYVRPLG